MPVRRRVNEDTALVFSSGNGNPISISDADAGSTGAGDADRHQRDDDARRHDGLTFSVGDGTADATMTFTGTIDQHQRRAERAVASLRRPNFNGAGEPAARHQRPGEHRDGRRPTDTTPSPSPSARSAIRRSVPGASPTDRPEDARPRVAWGSLARPWPRWRRRDERANAQLTRVTERHPRHGRHRVPADGIANGH